MVSRAAIKLSRKLSGGKVFFNYVLKDVVVHTPLHMYIRYDLQLRTFHNLKNIP
ncbi:hypothetical protein AGMMS49546_16180 [Spirochaetia bacterium]|nr:hypothetical protein AGMMS49546_16180 [Spirochaetia bacterium]